MSVLSDPAAWGKTPAPDIVPINDWCKCGLKGVHSNREHLEAMAEECPPYDDTPPPEICSYCGEPNEAWEESSYCSTHCYNECEGGGCGDEECWCQDG